MSICPTTDERSPRNNHVYGREFQTMLDGLDEEGCLEESGGHVSEKKRRLSVDQVKALEKNFEVENKLEPERKVKLAQELGLQPRQVAVWFQNRRARWKTKQLERDYGVLKANYEALKLNYDTLQHDNEALLKEIKELKSKLNEENTESINPVKEEKVLLVHETDNKTTTLQEESNKLPALVTSSLAAASDPDQELNYESFNNNDNGVLGGISLFPADFKDGSSDSDSSAILNEDNSPNAAISSSATTGIIQNQHHLDLLMSPTSSSLKHSPPPSINCFEFSKPTYQAQFVKMEEHNFFGDEACNFFSDDQAPSLPWYCSDQWTSLETPL